MTNSSPDSNGCFVCPIANRCMPRHGVGNLVLMSTMVIAVAMPVLADGNHEQNAEMPTYSFRSPDYSLVNEPQRIAPQTLDQPKVTPQDAVVFGWPIRWWSSHWSGPETNTAAGAMLWQEDGHPRFVVTETSKRKVWVKYLDVPISAQQYPLLAMTYRATGTDPDAEDYVIYLDDTSGPDYGGLLPFLGRDVIPDGKLHTLTCDLRELKPIGNLIGLAIGVRAGSQGSAAFDLVDLRFEALGSGERPLPVNGPVRRVLVLDQTGQAVKGATVTIDAGRDNWARSASTDAQGRATVQPYRTAGRRHMIRVTKPNMTPVEIRDLPVKTDGLIVAVMEPAAYYSGIVVDENDSPLPNTVVRITIESAGG